MLDGCGRSDRRVGWQRLARHGAGQVLSGVGRCDGVKSQPHHGACVHIAWQRPGFPVGTTNKRERELFLFRSLILGRSCCRCERPPSPPESGGVRPLCLEAWTKLKAQALADGGSPMVASCPTSDSSSCPPLTGWTRACGAGGSRKRLTLRVSFG